MCLAVPGRVISIEGDDPLTRQGRVDFGGIVKSVNLAYVPDVREQEYVLVHVGFAITVVDPREAKRVFEYLDTLEQEAGESESGGPMPR
ncbi:HypC/HybG/HupF family hydrogenase formation chaperone [Marinobacter sp. M216]|uniref:HypC/HybG/HupF family hydrogenase formation chaperone n=1 Tax=Marinobacter albus TaxID=3030833 RepID=A0ABT7H985_9GAMM|nr:MULTISPECIES: HypC/HybG/HupF family hydrogenase formation chaperone [unclassified Marinobacter]MBW7470823.1 HypC/HybG/HupF family hydrogenase formation chaperone [Marinobacter sp. F4218]MDK9556907.1 HypC/HybG/HupF family hydrogenase formation chaperone [Marinobacter sp. M216]